MSCLKCGKLFNKKHQKKYCSRSCHISHRNILLAKKRYCINCNKETKNIKFCSNKCYSDFSNVKRPHYCNICNTLIQYGWTARKYCDNCNYTSNPNYKDWSKITLKEFKLNRTTTNTHARIRDLARCLYNKSDKPKYCVKCSYRNTYEVCHIKPISSFSEDSYISDINHIDNLISLCPNCHWDLDHGLLNL